MAEGCPNVSTGPSDFTDADEPSPECGKPSRDSGRVSRAARAVSGPRIERSHERPASCGSSSSTTIPAGPGLPAQQARGRLGPDRRGVHRPARGAWDEVHLDHDLGGEIYVDSSRPDCGMEVVRWLCASRRDRFEKTLFIIHSHNAEAGADDGQVPERVRLPGRLPPVRRRSDRVARRTTTPTSEAGRGCRSVRRGSAWSEWIRRLSRRLRPGPRSRRGGPAAEDRPRRRRAARGLAPTTSPSPDEDARPWPR